MPKEMKAPECLGVHTYCPGCGHGIFVRLIHEILEEKGLIENNVCVIGSGCSSNLKGFIKGSNKIEAHHGRPPHVARGLKAMLPDCCIWTYQGDGDAYSIGLGETIQAAHAGDPYTVFVLNNTNYGMTGGQTALTTLPEQVTTTSPYGKKGPAFDAVPVLMQMEQVGYIARGATTSYAEIVKLKKYMTKAIDYQMKERKYAFVEIMSPCPTNWGKSPKEACDWIMNETAEYFPLGEFKG